MFRGRAIITTSFVFACVACSDSGDTTSDAGTPPLADAATDAGVPDAGDLDDPAFPRMTCAGISSCVQIKATEVSMLFDAINDLSDGSTIVLGMGTFELNNAVTIRGANRMTLTGQGIDVTILSFATQAGQTNGVDVVGDDFTIDHLTITDSKKDGLRIEDSTNVWIHHVKVTWSGGPLSTNGSYAIYPVRCTNVLLEDSEAHHASDAGLYVGQSVNVIVRRNIARRNVAGLEIENTQYADVYENTVESNSGGLLVFDLPGNPVIGRDILIHHNTIRQNNIPNFAPPGTTVASIPAGTGTFALASRRVEIRNNDYIENNTVDIAILSGLAIRSSTGSWALPIDDVRGSTVGLDLVRIGDRILNFETNQIWIHNNTHTGGGTRPDGMDQVNRPLGVLLSVVYFNMQVDDILYDGIGENVDPMTPANNTNRNHICLEAEGEATFAVLDLPRLGAMIDMGDLPTTADISQPAAPFTPFDCTGFESGPIPPVTLSFGN
jgi:parallel beta-helix repeat protein